MARGTNYKSEEARAREALHQFGGKEPNPSGKQRTGTDQREFYRWVEAKATRADLIAYANDESKPQARRMFVSALLKCERVQDFFDLTNQTHGKPKEQVEVSTEKETAAASRAEWEELYGNKG